MRRVLLLVFAVLIALFISCKSLPKGFSIEYQLDGGRVDGINPTSSLEVSESTVLINPEKMGYSFLGWVEQGSSELAVKNYTFSLPIEHEIVLNAIWRANEGTLSYDLQGGSWINGVVPKSTYSIADKSFSIPAPVRQGYAFLGWTDGSGSEPEKTYTVNTQKQVDIRLKANWAPVKYHIEYDKAGYYYMETETPYIVSYTIEDEDFDLAVPVRSGYTFVGWHIIGIEEQLDTIDHIYTRSCRDYALEAVWVPEIYSITYEMNGGYLPYEIKNPDSYSPFTESFTIVNPVKDNFRFLGWIVTGDKSGEIHPTLTIEQGRIGDLKLYAVYEWCDVPVGAVTEIYRRIPEYGKGGVPRPDWVVKAPEDNEYHYEKAYGKADDFYSSFQLAVNEAVILHSEWLKTKIDSEYGISGLEHVENKKIGSNMDVEGREVVEFWIDQNDGVWALVRIPVNS